MGAQRVLMVVRGASLFEAPSNQQQNQQNQQQPTQISRSKLQNSPKQSPRSIQAKQSPRVVYPSPRNINYTNLESTSARKSAPPVELSIMMTKLEADFMEIGEKGRWKCSIREGSLLEDWLNLMLQRGAPSISVVSEANAQTIDNNIKGLQEYGLSRTQLMSWGLSESQIDRVYRMLYVYPIGCQELLKELCMHCVEKSLLVGSFWRAFIRLCEERSKMKLQAEISGLMEQKENAINELRLVRGCLNEALDGIAFKKLVDVNSSEKEMSSDSSTGSKEFVGATSIQLKETEAQLEALSGMCDHIHRERQQLLDQVEVMAKKLRIEKVALAVAYFKEREKAAEHALCTMNGVPNNSEKRLV